MPKTKGWYIVSELNGYSLNLNDDGELELSSRAKDVWMKHNWLRQTIRLDDSDYDSVFIEGNKQACGHLKHSGTG